MLIEIPDHPVGRLGDAWRLCIGTGRMELALRRDYQDSLSLVQQEIGFRHIRGHGLFADGMGIHRPYTDVDGSERVHHSFGYLDQVMDAYLERGIRPFLELGFMPDGLASGDATVFWWRGNITPPRSQQEWAELVRATLRHLIDRYGAQEVRSWPVEVWNEPNLDVFWLDADQDAYHRLYATTARAVKEVDAELQVGGPSLAPGQNTWLREFAEFTEREQVPVDFVSRHAYSSGPAQHVPLFGTYQTLEPAATLLDQFAVPTKELAGTWLAGKPVHITEFNSSYRPDNPIHDTAFNAAYLAPVLAGGGDLVDSFSYWTFSDMFEEVGIPTSLFHGGFGLLSHRALKKPTFHLYAFLARMGDEVLGRGPDHLVTRDAAGRVTVLAWAPVDVTGREPTPERHRLQLSLPLAGDSERGWAHVVRSRVNEQVGNVRTAWQDLGSPASPDGRQLALLRELAEPHRSSTREAIHHGRVGVDLTLARHEVTLVELEAVTGQAPQWVDERRLLGHEPAEQTAPAPR